MSIRSSRTRRRQSTRDLVLAYLAHANDATRCAPTYVATMVSNDSRGFQAACSVINTLVASGTVIRSNIDGQITLSLPAAVGKDADALPSS